MSRLVRLASPLVAACLASCGDVSADRDVAVKSSPPPASVRRPEPPDGSKTDLPPVVAEKPERDADDIHREKAVGVWKQHYTGVRWLSIRPDGTATMFIDPDWIAKAIIGEPLTVRVEWSIDDGRALMKSVSGEPKSGFAATNALFGSERIRKVAELTDAKFVLLDEKDGSRSEWTRVGPDEPLPAALTVKPASPQR